MSSTFFMPPVNVIGENALVDAVATLKGYGFKKHSSLPMVSSLNQECLMKLSRF